MKTNIQFQQVQYWSLLGIKPMHRALLRRTVEQVSIPLMDAAASPFELTWCVFEATTNETRLECFERPGVLIIDRDTLTKQIGDHEAVDLNPNLYCERSNRQIRLLWDWCKRGKEDLMWCTELSFCGVIYDVESMNRWVRVCLKRGKVIQSQNNLLLRDLQLPKISLRSSVLV